MYGRSYGNPHNLPSVENYEKAKFLYNTIKPIRGRSVECKPLGKRRTDYMSITKGMLEDRPYYAAKLYGTECVRWFLNGDVHITSGGFATYTTRDFLSHVLPYLFHVALVRRQIRIAGYAVPRGRDDYLILSRVDEGGYIDNKYVVSNAIHEVIYKKNRAKTKQVAQRYADFRNWLKGYLSLKENKFFVDEIYSRDNTWYHHMDYPRPYTVKPEQLVEARERLLSLMLSTGEDKYEQYIKAADIVAATVGKMQYEGMCRTYSMDAFDKFMFKLHAPEILEVVEVPTGKTPPHNPYVAWMSGWINEAYK